MNKKFGPPNKKSCLYPCSHTHFLVIIVLNICYSLHWCRMVLAHPVALAPLIVRLEQLASLAVYYDLFEYPNIQLLT